MLTPQVAGAEPSTRTGQTAPKFRGAFPARLLAESRRAGTPQPPNARGYVNEYGEDDADWPDRDRVAPPRPDEDFPDGGDEDEDSWPEGGHRVRAGTCHVHGGGERGRPPNGVGKASRAQGCPR